MYTCYEASISQVQASKYSLLDVAKEKFRFLDIASFLDNSEFRLVAFEEESSPEGSQSSVGTVPSAAQPYAALSYPWRDLKALDPNIPTTNAFATCGTGDDEPPTSIDVLKAVCEAARQEGCTYLWMDKLSIRQDKLEAGVVDQAWQMKRMYDIYAKCKVCLVAAGGMVRLPRLIDRTSWINRAWTLQEALAPPRVQCLFTWKSDDRVINAGVMQSPPQKVRDADKDKGKDGVAMAGLDFLLTAGLHAEDPRVDGKVVLPNDPDSQVYLFGFRQEDDYPISALQGALERDNPIDVGSAGSAELSGRRLGIWRCITMRSARYPEDFVFATMGILGVRVDPLVDPKTDKIREQGYPEDEIQELLDSFLGVLASVGCRADWFAVAPELGPARETSALPLVPDINFTKDQTGRLAVPVKNLLNYWDRFNWYLKDALKYTVDAPNGIQITAPAHNVIFKGVLPLQNPARPMLERRHDKKPFEICDGGSCFAVVAGRKARYMGAAFPPLTGDTDVILLMLIDYIPFTVKRYRNIGYAWVNEGFTTGWTEETFGVGLRGG